MGGTAVPPLPPHASFRGLGRGLGSGLGRGLGRGLPLYCKII